MILQSGLAKNKTKISEAQALQLTKIISQTRSLATSVGLGKSGLIEAMKICDRILSLESEIDFKTRNARTMQQLGSISQIEEAISDANRLINKNLPAALATLSSFVDKRVAALADTISQSVEEFKSIPNGPSV